MSKKLDITRGYVSVFGNLRQLAISILAGTSLFVSMDVLSPAHSAALDAERIRTLAAKSMKFDKLKLFSTNSHVNFNFRQSKPDESMISFINFLSAFIPQMSNSRKGGDFYKSNIVIIIDENSQRKLQTGEYGFKVFNPMHADTYCFITYESDESGDFIKHGLIAVDSTVGQSKMNECVYHGILSFFGAVHLSEKSYHELNDEDIDTKLGIISDVIVSKVVAACKSKLIEDDTIDLEACLADAAGRFIK